MNHLGIDVRTKDAQRLMRRLGRLKSTSYTEFCGVYHADPNYAIVSVTTSMTESELDDWLWRTKHGCDYVGCFSMESPCAAT